MSLTITVRPMETAVQNGVRFIPIRHCLATGRTYLDVEYVCNSPEEALKIAREQEQFEMGGKWTAANPLVGVAEVNLTIVRQLNLADLSVSLIK